MRVFNKWQNWVPTDFSDVEFNYCLRKIQAGFVHLEVSPEAEKLSSLAIGGFGADSATFFQLLTALVFRCITANSLNDLLQ